MSENDTPDNGRLRLLTCTDAAMEMPPARLITVEEIRHLPTISAAQTADLLGLAVDTVTAALGRGQLPGFRVGTKWCVPVDRLLDLLERDGEASNSPDRATAPSALSVEALAAVLRRLADALAVEAGRTTGDG